MDISELAGILPMFVGGELQIFDPGEKGVYFCGNVTEISLSDESIEVEFAWLALHNGPISEKDPLPKKGWHLEKKPIRHSVFFGSMFGIGDDGFLRMSTPLFGGTVTFSPPGGRTLLDRVEIPELTEFLTNQKPEIVAK